MAYLIKIHQQWRDTINDNILDKTLLNEISTFIVISCHLNEKTRTAHPSIRRIAILTGLKETTVMETIKNLEAKDWLTIQKARNKYGLYHNIYHIQKTRYNLTIPSTLITNHIWTYLKPSEKKTYLILRAVSTLEKPPYYPFFVNQQELTPNQVKNYWFSMPHRAIHRYIRKKLNQTHNTAQSALKKLYALNLINNYTQNTDRGVALPIQPNITYPKLTPHQTKQQNKLLSLKTPTPNENNYQQAITYD